ncbi:MAG: hypothetical protein QW292_11385 [Candidatus Parvarchaeota archaeon]
MKKGERFAPSIIKKNSPDGIDNASKADQLLRHTMSLGSGMKMALMDRGYHDVGVMKKMEYLGLKYLVPAKDNSKVLGAKRMEMIHTDRGLSYLALGDIISPGFEGIDASFVDVLYYL